MLFDFETCYAAVKNRDSRYDGAFFTGVSSTGIFCRPVCPAVTPKPENCEFYPSAAAAMVAGYRPCLRCRPESAPNSPAWNGVKTTVKRALTLINQGALDAHTVSHLADRLGISERYLRRLFSKYVGASPKAVARTRRVMLAKRLISDSTDSMTTVAYKAGFSSVRQFNDTFHKLYGVPPGTLRRLPHSIPLQKMKTSIKKLVSTIYKSPIKVIGEILMIADGGQLCFLDFADNDERVERLLGRRYGDYEITQQADVLGMQSRMARYFSGDWQAFADLKSEHLATAGTPFQQRVWDSLKTIPVGEAISYRQLASAIQQPQAVRAAANANANNPLAIIIPCHRVIGNDGSLRGYAGGIDRKAWLLNHEGFSI